QAGIGLSMLRVAFRSRQASHRLLRIRFASMTQFDGMSSEHHPKRYVRRGRNRQAKKARKEN
ncbi:hypothetical protein, partial [Ralstonia pseudosolanacearum]|uniref:hypothetical protein n=1 Tax=Ralstonia pseudosolanacearum TaxID=1310165 RepID=UPI0020030E60